MGRRTIREIVARAQEEVKMTDTFERIQLLTPEEVLMINEQLDEWKRRALAAEDLVEEYRRQLDG